MASRETLHRLLVRSFPQCDPADIPALVDRVLGVTDAMALQEGTRLTDRAIDAAIAKWYGITAAPPQTNEQRVRMTHAVYAALQVRPTTLQEDVDALLARAIGEGQVVTIRTESVPPLAMGRVVQVASIEPASNAQQAWRAYLYPNQATPA